MDKTFSMHYSEIKQELGYHTGSLTGKLERLQTQLAFAKQLCSIDPENAAAWSARILEAGELVNAGLCRPGGDIDALIASAEAVLAPLGETAKTYTLLCVGHAHIDMNWQWSWPETVGLTHDTFQTMLKLMDEFPEFVFSQSQASVYALIEKYNPAMFERIRQRVREGRWEVTASQWVEGDKNLANGESISRHLLYTRAYFQDKFDLTPEDVRIDFEPDTFGHPATMPAILTQGGVRYYYHCRGSRGPHVYWWVGADGSRILTFNDIQWYMHFDADHRSVAIAPNMAEPLIPYAAETGLKTMPVLYGVGDHGGGPTRRDLQRLHEMQTWPIYPRIEFSTLQHFFDVAEAAAVALPEIHGERNFVFAGCYTSQARQKEANRHGENLLYAAEAAASLGDRLADVPYPYENLEAAWRQLLFDQFHDILPGSGIQATRHYTLGHAQDVQAAAMMARTNALRALSRRVNTEPLRKDFVLEGVVRTHKDARESGISLGAGVGNATGAGGESAFSTAQTSDRVYLVFNSLSHARREVIRVKLWDTTLDPAHLVASSEDDPVLPVQVLGHGHYAGHSYLEVAFPVASPALGYTNVCVSDRRLELGLPEPAPENLWDGVGGAGRTREIDQATLENEFIRVQLEAASGSIVSLVDKRSGRDWVAPGKSLGILQYCLEANQGMTAWVIGQFMKRQDLKNGGRLEKVHDGPHVFTYRWTRTLEDATSIALEISVTAGLPRVEFNARIDWRGIGSAQKGIPHLKVRFPLSIDQPKALYEIPFGSIQRDLFNGEEVPAQRWVDLSEVDGQGVTLVNTSKYGFNVEGTSLNMTLLRGSIDPDPLPDLGVHTIQYALVVHEAGWSTGNCVQAGEDLNIPLDVVSSDFHDGDLPVRHSLVGVEPANVRLVSMKKSQDGTALVLRLVEVEGKDTTALLSFSTALVGEDAQVCVADTLERTLDQPCYSVAEGSISVPIEAYSVLTLRVED